MQPSDRCAALVRAFEGCVLHAYPDPKSGGDPWTIGWGHTGLNIARGLVWTQAQADAALIADLARIGRAVAAMVGETTQDRFDALVSFAFNLGPGRLAGSTLLRLHLAGRYAAAAAEFGKWISKGSPAEKGLIRRRAAEMRLYLGQHSS